MHLWELSAIYSDDDFFDENRSFNLLFLMEAARPSLHLTDRNWRWTIPVDTIRFSPDQNGNLEISWGGPPREEQTRIKMTWNTHFLVVEVLLLRGAAVVRSATFSQRGSLL